MTINRLQFPLLHTFNRTLVLSPAVFYRYYTMVGMRLLTIRYVDNSLLSCDWV
jgi:hypothetical protein